MYCGSICEDPFTAAGAEIAEAAQRDNRGLS